MSDDLKNCKRITFIRLALENYMIMNNSQKLEPNVDNYASPRVPPAIVIGVLCAAMLGSEAHGSEIPVKPANRPGFMADSSKVKPGSTGDVNIVNTPKVEIVNTRPLAVQPGFPSGFQPFITNMVLAVTNGSWGAQMPSFVVPDGKMLVIEQVNARIHLPYGQSIGSFALATVSSQGSAGFFFIAAQPQSIEANTGTSAFIANSPLRAYVTPQSRVFFNFDRSSPTGDSSYGYVTVAGYLVDSPVSAD